MGFVRVPHSADSMFQRNPGNVLIATCQGLDAATALFSREAVDGLAMNETGGALFDVFNN